MHRKRCSPIWSKERVFTLTIRFKKKQLQPKKPHRSYRNPIYVAKEYNRMIRAGEVKSESDLARKLGISRVRVCQYVRLLSLNDSVIKALEQLGDPLSRQMITERKLRVYLSKEQRKQKEIISLIARK